MFVQVVNVAKCTTTKLTKLIVIKHLSLLMQCMQHLTSSFNDGLIRGVDLQRPLLGSYIEFSRFGICHLYIQHVAYDRSNLEND